MKSRILWTAIVWLGFLQVAGIASAVETRTVVHYTPDTFVGGDFDRVAIGEDGTLTLAPGVTARLEVPDPVVWKVVRAEDGTRYVATGTDGRVYRFVPGASKPEVVADFDETQVMALAFRSDGALVAGTSPDGRIYRIQAGQKPEVLADPAATYVWDIVPEAGGSLFIATGTPGQILRLTLDGKLQPVLDTEEAHLLSLTIDSAGRWWAGSANNGYVYTGGDAKTRPSIALDAPGEEVKALVSLPEGGVLVMTVGSADGNDTNDHELSALLGKEANTGASAGQETRLYRLRPPALPELMVRLQGVVAHAMGRQTGRTLLGLGTGGKILAVGDDKKISLVADLPGEQITALTRAPDGSMGVGVSHPGGLATLEDRPASEGTFTSEALDSGLLGRWGRIDVRLEQPASGRVDLETRSGNSKKPNTTWSDWQRCDGDVRSPPARFLQYRLTLHAQASVSPRVRQVTVRYLPANSAPTLGNITVLDPAIRIDLKEDFRTDPEPRGINRPRPAPTQPQVKEREEPEMQAARWEATDPDGDTLQYRVSIREVSSPIWKSIAPDQENAFVNFRASSFPDGWYQLQVVVRDSPSNRPEDVLETDTVSVPFPVDFTPPEVKAQPVRYEGRRAVVGVSGTDVTTPLARARLAIDGGPYGPLFPDDGVFDELEETLTVQTGELTPGDHLLVVQLEDGVQNLTTFKIPLKGR